MKARYGGILGGLVMLAVGTPVGAQISTDRPDFTEGTRTVPDGRLQLEAGYTYEDADRATTHTVGEALFRYGLIPGLELRIGLPSFQSYTIDRPILGEFEASGLSDASLGMKLGLYEAGMAEGLPSVSVLFGTVVPTGESELPESAGGWEPEAILAIGWEFVESLELGANVGYAQRDNGADRFDEFLASVSLGFPLMGALSGFGEYYAIRPDGGADQDFIDGGLMFQLSPDFQLDARVGVGVGDTEDTLIFGVGFAKLF